MKKVIIYILALIMVLGIVGCSSAPAEETTSTPQPTEEVTQAPEATPEPTPEPTPTEAPSSWRIDYYVDDFGDDTEESYVAGTFFGDFSNSATSGSDLLVFINYDKQSSMWIRLVEYASHIANIDSSDTAILKLKCDDNVSTYDMITYDFTSDCYLKSEDVGDIV